MSQPVNHLQDLLIKDLWLLIGSYLNYLHDLPIFKQVIPDLNFKPIDRIFYEDYYHKIHKFLCKRITYLDYIKVKIETWYLDKSKDLKESLDSKDFKDSKESLRFYDKSGVLKYSRYWHPNCKLRQVQVNYGLNYIETRMYHLDGSIEGESYTDSEQNGIYYHWDVTGELKALFEVMNEKRKCILYSYLPDNDCSLCTIRNYKNHVLDGPEVVYQNHRHFETLYHKDDEEIKIW